MGPLALASAAGGIYGLVQVDPKNAGEQRNGWNKRQEQDDRPDGGLADAPAGQRPEKTGNQCDYRQRQTVADVHGAQEIAGFPFIAKIADGTALVHLGEAQENGVVEDF